MALEDLLKLMGEEVEDPEEEIFLLFSQSMPSQNLGFVDAKATELEVNVSGGDLHIVQSPGLLSSSREGGTTGAVIWKITPLFAEWITSEDNVFFDTAVFDKSSEVLELGCGSSGIVAITLAPKIGRYIATDQEYVFKLLSINIEENSLNHQAPIKSKPRGKGKVSRVPESSAANINIVALDWETSSVSNLPALTTSGLSDKSNDLAAVIACDCIYNEALIDPFVQTCAAICQIYEAIPHGKRTLCVIAQQLRSDLVFEAWLLAFHKVFRVWRVPDELLIEDLRQGSGFVVHVGVLRKA